MSNMGTSLLVDQRDYTYYINKRAKTDSKVFWECTFRRKNKCNARAVTYQNKITKLSGEHCHEPDYEKQLFV